jgi:hypothetical protein
MLHCPLVEAVEKGVWFNTSARESERRKHAKNEVVNISEE